VLRRNARRACQVGAGINPGGEYGFSHLRFEILKEGPLLKKGGMLRLKEAYITVKRDLLRRERDLIRREGEGGRERKQARARESYIERISKILRENKQDSSRE